MRAEAAIRQDQAQAKGGGALSAESLGCFSQRRESRRSDRGRARQGGYREDKGKDFFR